MLFFIYTFSSCFKTTKINLSICFVDLYFSMDAVESNAAVADFRVFITAFINMFLEKTQIFFLASNFWPTVLIVLTTFNRKPHKWDAENDYICLQVTTRVPGEDGEKVFENANHDQVWEGSFEVQRRMVTDHIIVWRVEKGKKKFYSIRVISNILNLFLFVASQPVYVFG